MRLCIVGQKVISEYKYNRVVCDKRSQITQCRKWTLSQRTCLYNAEGESMGSLKIPCDSYKVGYVMNGFLYWYCFLTKNYYRTQVMEG